MGYNRAKKKMKKKILLVSAIVVTSMVMMFVSCKKETPQTPQQQLIGCNCKLEYLDDTSETYTYSKNEMQSYYGAEINNCSTWTGFLLDDPFVRTATCSGVY